MKDAEQDEVPDVTLAPEVAKSVPIPIEEQNPTPAKPELKVESHLESVDAEPPIFKPVGVGVTSDPKDLEPVVRHDSPMALTFLKHRLNLTQGSSREG